MLRYFERIYRSSSGWSVNDVCITNGVIYMYKTVNLKTKLFTKLTNQNSYDEARAIGCISNIILQDRSCQWSQVRFIPFWSVPAFSIKCCSMNKRMLSLLLLIWRIGISWTSFKACLGWLKWMGTDSWVLFWIPRLCSPKRSEYKMLQNVAVKPSKMLHSLLTDAQKTYVIF